MVRRIMFMAKHVEPIRNPENGFKSVTTRFNPLKAGRVYMVWTGSRYKPIDTAVLIEIVKVEKLLLKDYTDEMLYRDVGHTDLEGFAHTLQSLNSKPVDMFLTLLYFHEFRLIKSPTLTEF